MIRDHYVSGIFMQEKLRDTVVEMNETCDAWSGNVIAMIALLIIRFATTRDTIPNRQSERNVLMWSVSIFELGVQDFITI